MAVPGRGARGAPRQGRPRVAPVARHLDPVADDVAAALVGRRAPVELDRRDAVGRRGERPRRARRLALAGVVPDGRELELLREVAGPVPERPGAHVVVEHLDFVAGTDRAGQRQDHLRRVDLDPRHPLGVRIAVPGDEHVEVGGRRDGALVEVLVERDDELVADHFGAERLGNPGVRLEVVRFRDVALDGVRRLVTYCGHRTRWNCDDHRTLIVVPRSHVDEIVPVGAVQVAHGADGVRAEDIEVLGREVLHVSREADVEAEFLLRIPRPCMTHRRHPGRNWCGRGHARDRWGGRVVGSGGKCPPRVDARGRHQGRADHRGGQERMGRCAKLARNHRVVSVSGAPPRSRPGRSSYARGRRLRRGKARPRPANRTGAAVTAAGN